MKAGLAALGAAMVGLYFALRKKAGGSPTPQPQPVLTAEVEPGQFYRFTWVKAGGSMTPHQLSLFVSNTMYKQFAFTNVTTDSPAQGTVLTTGQATQKQVFDLPLEHGPATLTKVEPLKVEP